MFQLCVYVGCIVVDSLSADGLVSWSYSLECGGMTLARLTLPLILQSFQHAFGNWLCGFLMFLYAKPRSATISLNFIWNVLWRLASLMSFTCHVGSIIKINWYLLQTFRKPTMYVELLYELHKYNIILIYCIQMFLCRRTSSLTFIAS